MNNIISNQRERELRKGEIENTHHLNDEK